MKNSFFCIIVLFCCTTAFCQNYNINLQKYWWYRYRLINDFSKIGPNFGESLPMGKRIYLNPKTELAWGDAIQKQGSYLITLATEHKLQKLAGYSTGRLNLELYYALNAINRLDNNSEEYCRHWNDGSSTNTVNISIQNNVGMIPHHGSSDVWVEDLNGLFGRDDNFVTISKFLKI
ncbi:MAG: hypothetical protein ABI378_00615 [Chitinophagaceae bacterium]